MTQSQKNVLKLITSGLFLIFGATFVLTSCNKTSSTVAVAYVQVGQNVAPGNISGSIKGTIFLLCLVFCASLMPVEDLPNASWVTAFILGFVSSVFDNIPLTKLCLNQGCYDWGMLAYAVGF